MMQVCVCERYPGADIKLPDAVICLVKSLSYRVIVYSAINARRRPPLHRYFLGAEEERIDNSIEIIANSIMNG